ncbi:acylphosphatase [Nocardioides sp.]|uniref:acylphosphatase n=1 Tax=Nocardioides sp. TaxID=35761 RepID=UPI002737376E|nr:acylphosphatase [Nocardioides sp.]MDP3894566.1 acylphosphatase [Nocardioides sp.]
MAGPDVVAREVVVHGRVQGVFFRESCRREAQQGSLTGWVSNEPDGTVRAWFEGPKAQVDAICEWCRHGPPSARVTRVELVNRQPEGLSGFDVR